MGAYVPSFEPPALAAQPEDPERIARRRLAAAVLAQAVREARAGAADAAQWLAQASDGDTRPSSAGWWCAVAGIEAESLAPLRRAARQAPTRRQPLARLRSVRTRATA